MSQQQKLQWKTYQGVESVYWSTFKQVNEYPMLVTQFIGTGNGYNPASYGPFEHEGYIYSAVEKPTRADPKKTYFNIERRPKAAGASTPQGSQHNGDYEARQQAIQKNHDERMALDRERLALDKERFEFDKAMFAQNQAVILQLVDLTHQIQLLVKSVIEIKSLFVTADKLQAVPAAVSVSKEAAEQ